MTCFVRLNFVMNDSGLVKKYAQKCFSRNVSEDSSQPALSDQAPRL